jgi:spermidine synthase
LSLPTTDPSVIPQELLDTAHVPGQVGELQLYRQGGEFILRVHGTDLMSSRVHGSEELLAELALDRLPGSGSGSGSARVLVGGLGMGFTLARVLDLVGTEAWVDVVELVPKVVDWNREWLGELNGHPLRDPRVTVLEGDVAQHIRDANSSYDTILLDVDNGPKGLTRDANDWLYDHHGLTTAGDALRPGGVLAIWSAAYHPWFSDRLRAAGFEVLEQPVRARRTKGARRTIWLASRR